MYVRRELVLAANIESPLTSNNQMRDTSHPGPQMFPLSEQCVAKGRKKPATKHYRRQHNGQNRLQYRQGINHHGFPIHPQRPFRAMK
jgi:hypothetical protein